jgi:hypothetical protein
MSLFVTAILVNGAWGVGTGVFLTRHKSCPAGLAER